jgi:hypothetical protein
MHSPFVPQGKQECLWYTENGVVIGFGAAAGEDNFLGARAEQRCDRFAGRFNRGAAFWPNVWIEAALPNSAEKYGSIASSTSGSTGVVALKSR